MMENCSTQEVVTLQPSIEQLITKICAQICIQPPDDYARRLLSTITESSAIEILNKISKSNSIRTFTGFVIHMVNNNSPDKPSTLPQKRSPSPSATAGTPKKCACYVSPNSKQFVRSPSSSSKCRTTTEDFPLSPNDGYGSLLSKQITSLPCSGLTFANSNVATCHLPESPNATHRVQKQLIFLEGCDLHDADRGKVTQQLIDSSSASHQFSAVQKQCILSPSSNSKAPSHKHFSVFSSATHNSSLIQEQPNSSPRERFGGPTCVNTESGFGSMTQNRSNGTKNLAINQQPRQLFGSSSASHQLSVVQKQHTFSPCPSTKATSPKQFSDFSSDTHNGSLVREQHTLSPCENIRRATCGNMEPGFGSMTQNRSNSLNNLTFSQQSLLLAELEFRKMFMVYSYVGRKKLEDVVSIEDAIDINKMKTVTMFNFEAKIWAKYGQRFCESSDRAMHFDWDAGKTYLYHCYVSADGTHQFKGPYLNTRRTHLQRELGDDNVLIVQFSDDPDTPYMPSNHCNWHAAYQRIAGGISIGLRHYRLFAFKDGRDNKNLKVHSTKKSRSSWGVKCYFIRKESHAPWTEKDSCILFKKTSHEARCLFMHVHMVSSVAKYISRCSLALSNTIRLRVDLAYVHVERIEDIPCRDENCYVVCDEDGEALIHTDGTGFISEDLAILCAKDFLEAKGTNDDNYELIDLLKLEEASLGIEPPLLVQCRLFKEGYAVKGTLLVNKKLKARTIQIRPSMIKVEKDARLSDSRSFSSLEIVSISRRPRKANLSKNLIALLSVGGVPKEYFLCLLKNTLQDAQKLSSSMRAAVRVGLNYGQMDDSATSVTMIGSGIPLDEPYLQYRLSILANEERKGLRGGKIPINESFYLIGTADPTGTLNSDEVCIILENGQVSGKVLVYRNPGLHFGDIHILNATYVKELEEFVGNAKYGIFFSTKGKRSVGSEIANGDFDGDLYWVSKSAELLHSFKVSEPWERIHSTPSAPSKKPSELSYDELENELFTRLFATQKQRETCSYNLDSAMKELIEKTQRISTVPVDGHELIMLIFDRNEIIVDLRHYENMVAGKAADSWLTFMDQYLTLGEDDADEKQRIKEKLLKLVDLYYDALDAPKSGKMVELPRCLLPQKYPHYLEKNTDKTFISSSVLGEIYDTAKAYQPDNALIQNIWRLPCFDVDIPEASLNLWTDRYTSYRQEMWGALSSGDESKNDSANIVVKKYKQMLYEVEDFATSSRKMEDIYNEALAIYHVSYEYAHRCADVRKCGFAWKVAGEALCSYHEMKTPGRSIPFKVAALSMLI